MSHGYGEARPIGRMVPARPTSEPRTPAWCKCGTKLSIYRQHGTEHTCALCQAKAATTKRERDEERAAKQADKPAPTARHETSASIAARKAAA